MITVIDTKNDVKFIYNLKDRFYMLKLPFLYHLYLKKPFHSHQNWNEDPPVRSLGEVMEILKYKKGEVQLYRHFDN